MTDGGQDFDLGQVVGSDGATGNGVASVTLISTSGKVKTYRMTFTDGTYVDYQVTDGSDASVTIVTSWNSTTSNSKVPSEKLTKDSLDTKVDKVTGKGLSTNDFTNSYKNTIDGLSTVATTGDYDDLTDKPTIPSKISDLTNDSDFIETSSTSGLIKNDGTIMTSGTGSSNWAVGNHTHSAYVNPTKVTSWSSTPSDNNVASEKLIKDSLDDKVSKSSTTGLLKNDGTVDTTSYSTFSGSYNDLSNKPSIPSSSSDLSDGSDLVKKSSTTGLLKNDGSVDTSSYLTTSSASSTYQPKLTSGTNIKTINNESLLGSGNITIQGGSSVDIVTAWESTPSDSKVASEKLTKDTLDTKIAKSSTSGLVKNDGSIDTNAYLTSSAISGMLTSSDVANNLTTTASGKVLDARQGKALADLIGDAIQYINQ